MRRRDTADDCANPDVVVERGDKLVYATGAIADLLRRRRARAGSRRAALSAVYEQALGLPRPRAGNR